MTESVLLYSLCSNVTKSVLYSASVLYRYKGWNRCDGGFSTAAHKVATYFTDIHTAKNSPQSVQWLPLWLLCWSSVYSVGPLQLAGHFDVLDGSNGSCGQGNGGWTNQVNFWAIFFQMENFMGNWCKILPKLC